MKRHPITVCMERDGVDLVIDCLAAWDGTEEAEVEIVRWCVDVDHRNQDWQPRATCPVDYADRELIDRAADKLIDATADDREPPEWAHGDYLRDEAKDRRVTR